MVLSVIRQGLDILASYHVLAYMLVAPLVWLLVGQRWAGELRLMNGLFAGAGLYLLVCWVVEAFHNWYSQVEFVQYAFVNRITGPYAWAVWSPVAGYVAGQLFWLRRFRQSGWLILLIGGLWLFGTLFPFLTFWHHDYLPSSWTMFSPKQLLILLLSPLFILEVKLLRHCVALLRRP